MSSKLSKDLMLAYHLFLISQFITINIVRLHKVFSDIIYQWTVTRICAHECFTQMVVRAHGN